MLSDFFKKLMLTRNLSINEGRITAGGMRQIMVTPFMLENIEELIREEIGNEKSIRTMYKAGKQSGRELSKSIEKSVDIHGIKLIEFIIMTVAEFAGWGKFTLIKSDIKNKEFIFNVNNSPIPEISKRSNKPLCNVTRGMVAGFLSNVFRNEDIDAVEVKCEAMGSDFCQFIVKPTSQFNFKSQIVQEQLQIKKPKNKIK